MAYIPTVMRPSLEHHLGRGTFRKCRRGSRLAQREEITTSYTCDTTRRHRGTSRADRA